MRQDTHVLVFTVGQAPGEEARMSISAIDGVISSLIFQIPAVNLSQADVAMITAKYGELYNIAAENGYSWPGAGG